MLKKLFAYSAAAAFLCGAANSARAGGFETPDNGTEALGRGGAFVAKADDGTALEYNPAGLARQMGIRITTGSNFILHDISFTRSGVYPGMASDPNTPFAGQPFPKVSDSDNNFPVPYFTASVGLPVLKGLTIAAGIYGPHSPGIHNYGADPAHPETPATVKLANGMTAPAPTRYLLAQDNLFIVYPTLAVALRPIKQLSIGAAAQYVYATFDLENAAITNLGPSSCPSSEYPQCDAYSHIVTSSDSDHIDMLYVLSALASPTDWLDVGATFRTGTDVHTTGTLTAFSPPAFAMPANDFPQSSFTSHLPMFLRLGGRYIFRRPDGGEKGDVELDLTWENWSSEKTDHIHVDNFLFSPTLDADVVHNYMDTYGVRLGGAYNLDLGPTMSLALRAGLYFDSATTHYQDTSIDFNTAAKYAGTLGLGWNWKWLTVNAAYAYVYSPTRDVTTSELTALSAINGNPDPKKGDPIVYVGNGRFEASTQILSIGVVVHFDDVFAKR